LSAIAAQQQGQQYHRQHVGVDDQVTWSQENNTSHTMCGAMYRHRGVLIGFWTMGDTRYRAELVLGIATVALRRRLGVSQKTPGPFT